MGVETTNKGEKGGRKRKYCAVQGAGLLVGCHARTLAAIIDRMQGRKERFWEIREEMGL